MPKTWQVPESHAVSAYFSHTFVKRISTLFLDVFLPAHMPFFSCQACLIPHLAAGNPCCRSLALTPHSYIHTGRHDYAQYVQKKSINDLLSDLDRFGMGSLLIFDIIQLPSITHNWYYSSQIVPYLVLYIICINHYRVMMVIAQMRLSSNASGLRDQNGTTQEYSNLQQHTLTLPFTNSCIVLHMYICMTVCMYCNVLYCTVLCCVVLYCIVIM